jgi:hypothetical protein
LIHFENFSSHCPRYYADPNQPKAPEQQADEPPKKAVVQIDPEQLLREAEEQAEEAGNDQVRI